MSLVKSHGIKSQGKKSQKTSVLQTYRKFQLYFPRLVKIKSSNDKNLQHWKKDFFLANILHCFMPYFWVSWLFFNLLFILWLSVLLPYIIYSLIKTQSVFLSNGPEMYRLGISLAYASNQCTALGWDHNTDSFTCTECVLIHNPPKEFFFSPFFSPLNLNFQAVTG